MGRSSRKVLVGIAVIVLVFALVVASIASGILPIFGPGKTTVSYVAAASTGESTTKPVLCTDFDPAQELANSKVAGGSSSNFPGYDEQLWLGFEQNFSSSISLGPGTPISLMLMLMKPTSSMSGVM